MQLKVMFYLWVEYNGLVSNRAFLFFLYFMMIVWIIKCKYVIKALKFKSVVWARNLIFIKLKEFEFLLDLLK